MPNPVLPVPGAPSSGTAPHDVAREPELASAAQRVTADLEALTDSELLPVNLDVQSVIATVLGANRLIQTHLGDFATLPGVNVDAIRKLGDYAHALLFWSASATYAVTPKPEIAAAAERALELRERYTHDLEALVRHGVLAKEHIAKLGGSAAYRKVALDLVAISNLVHERWADLSGKTMITLAAMDEISALGQRIIQSIGDREFVEAQLARDVARRNRAYTLVIRTYDEVRSALLFLRRAEEDADRIAPSLYAGRRGKPEDKSAPVASANPANSAATAAPTTLGPTTSSLIVADDASP